MNSAFKSTSVSGPGQVSLPALGTTSALGGNMAKPTMFGTTAPQTNTFGQTGTLFGGQGGAPGPQQQQPNSLFGTSTQGSLFGGQPQTQPQATSLFGNPSSIAPGAQSTSLFGQTAPIAQNPTSSLFSTSQAPNQTSLFGNPSSIAPGAQSTSLFGQTGPIAQNPTSSLFPSTSQAPHQTSLFGGQQAQPQQNVFSQLMTPFLSAPSMDPNLQMLLPQMMLALALNNPNGQSNNALDMVTKLSNMMNNNDKNINNNTSYNNNNRNSGGYNSSGLTPFDELML